MGFINNLGTLFLDLIKLIAFEQDERLEGLSIRAGLNLKEFKTQPNVYILQTDFCFEVPEPFFAPLFKGAFDQVPGLVNSGITKEAAFTLKSGERKNQLWHRSVMEVFLGSSDRSDYFEIHLNFEGHWNVFYLASYRQNLIEVPFAKLNSCACSLQNGLRLLSVKAEFEFSLPGAVVTNDIHPDRVGDQQLKSNMESLIQAKLDRTNQAVILEHLPNQFWHFAKSFASAKNKVLDFHLF